MMESAETDVVLLRADKALVARAVPQVLVLRVDLLPLNPRHADGEGGVTGLSAFTQQMTSAVYLVHCEHSVTTMNYLISSKKITN